jgi:KDO2-lipid IV(A) lauroyltransferase
VKRVAAATAKDLAEYLPMRASHWLLQRLPVGLADALGSGVGRLAASGPLALRREVVERQIAASFPDRPPSWVRATAAACYRHFGREWAEIARLGRTGPAGLPGRTLAADEAVATYRSHVTGARGGIIVTGHLGNWEAAGAFLAASGIPLAAVVKRQSNALADRYLKTLRRRIGFESIYMRDATSCMPEALRSGLAVALAADQDARGRGIFVSFLGRPASTFRGPVRLALAEGVPLFFIAMVREGRAYRFILEPIPAPPLGPDAEAEFTRRWMARLEHWVRRYPEQYWWFHRRWKTVPEGTQGGRER